MRAPSTESTGTKDPNTPVKKPIKKGLRQVRRAKRLGPFSGRTGVLAVDLRTREGKFYMMTREALIEHVEAGGEQITMAQRMVCEATAMLWTRFALLADRMMDPAYGSGSAEQLLALNASIRSNLKELGFKRQRAEVILPSPVQILEGKANDQ